MDTAPAIVLITGLPGSGKSTVAAAAAEHLGAPVLAWDWAMAGLTPFDLVQEALRGLDPRTYADVGWSVLLNLGVAQIRQGRSAVLDGVARQRQIEAARAVAAREGARLVVVLVRCPDEAVHRQRIEGRRRDIPGWHELAWADVARSRSRWVDPEGVDLELDSTRSLDETRVALAVGLSRS